MKYRYTFWFNKSEYDTVSFESDKQAIPLDLSKGDTIYFGAVPQEFINQNTKKEDLVVLQGWFKFKGKRHNVETTGFETTYSFKAIK